MCSLHHAPTLIRVRCVCPCHSDWDVTKAGAAQPGAAPTDQVVVLCGKKTTMNNVVKLVLGGCVPPPTRPCPLAAALTRRLASSVLCSPFPCSPLPCCVHGDRVLVGIVLSVALSRGGDGGDGGGRGGGGSGERVVS